MSLQTCSGRRFRKRKSRIGRKETADGRIDPMALPIHVDGYSAYRLNERPLGFELDGVYYRIYALKISGTPQARSISKFELLGSDLSFATIKPTMTGRSRSEGDGLHFGITGEVSELQA